MPDRRSTRRQVLGLGAAAFAAVSLKPPASALAGRRALFELDLAGEDLTASIAGARWRRTRVLRAPRRFDLIGLRWARGSHAEAQVRARRRGGRWTAWAALHVMGDHGPDGARPIAGTDPAFVGAADEFQLRLRGNPRALRARFVRALPTATVARRVGERLRRRARISARRQVQGPSVRVITRTEWGGESVPPRAPADYGTVQVAFVHHTVTTNTYDPEDSAGIVLGIARYHRDSNGWNDLGYNFLVDKYGQVFEGRAGGIEAPVIGAQAQGYNSVSTGIAVLGTHTEIAGSEPALDALARLIGWKLTLHNVPVQGQVTVTSAGGSANRFPSGTPVTLQRISGHRDGDATSCPGDVLYGQLADLRARAARYAAPVAALTMHTAKSVRGVKPSSVGGQLRFADGSSPAGVPIEIEIQAGGAAWTYYAGAVANADGSWLASVSLPYSANLRAVFPGDSRPRMESKAVAVKVLRDLQFSVGSKRPRRRRAVKLRGTVSPASRRVTVNFQRRSGRRWVRVQYKRIPVNDGAFATIVRPPVPGRYRVTLSAGSAKRTRSFRAR